jgi:hypothetical protein
MCLQGQAIKQTKIDRLLEAIERLTRAVNMLPQAPNTMQHLCNPGLNAYPNHHPLTPLRNYHDQV